jgi:hypothetical protein
MPFSSNRHAALRYAWSMIFHAWSMIFHAWSMIFPKTGVHFSGSCSEASLLRLRLFPLRALHLGGLAGNADVRAQALAARAAAAGAAAIAPPQARGIGGAVVVDVDRRRLGAGRRRRARSFLCGSADDRQRCQCQNEQSGHVDTLLWRSLRGDRDITAQTHRSPGRHRRSGRRRRGLRCARGPACARRTPWPGTRPGRQ